MCVLRHFDQSDPLQGIAVSFRHMPGQPLASREQRPTQCPGVPPFLVLNEEAVREMEEEAWRAARIPGGVWSRRSTADAQSAVLPATPTYWRVVSSASGSPLTPPFRCHRSGVRARRTAAKPRGPGYPPQGDVATTTAPAFRPARRCRIRCCGRTAAGDKGGASRRMNDAVGCLRVPLASVDSSRFGTVLDCGSPVKRGVAMARTGAPRASRPFVRCVRLAKQTAAGRPLGSSEPPR